MIDFEDCLFAFDRASLGMPFVSTEHVLYLLERVINMYLYMKYTNSTL